jgi:hypothetical protein
MGKIAFLSDGRFEPMAFAQRFKALKDQGHELIRVAPQEIRTPGKNSKDGVTGRMKSLPMWRAGKFDALLILQKYSLSQLQMNKELVRFVTDFLESGKPVWTHDPDGIISNSHGWQKMPPI